MELEAGVRAQAQQEKTVRRIADLDTLEEPVHLIGIGGIGMSGIARLLLSAGKAVSGSDKADNEILSELKEMGAVVFIGHAAANVKDARSVVVSTAITDENPELREARARTLPVWHRSDLLAALSRKKKLIAVSGTHGKTTTTGMVAQVLLDGGLCPSVVVGGVFERIGSNACAGGGEYFVAETDESDGTHANVESHIAVLTNIEPDHLENYPGGLEQIRDLMMSFLKNCKHAVVLCTDDAGCRAVMSKITGQRVITYGRCDLSPEANYTYRSLEGGKLDVFKRGVRLGEVTMAVPGEHNKQNALAAIAVADELGVPFETIAGGLGAFTGVDRRFQIIGQGQGILVVDDYAHHPTEVAATLEAARQFMSTRGKGRIVALFQPHQPNRLRDLWNEFCHSFQDADLVLLADVYVARGKPIEGVDSARFAKAVKHDNVHYVAGPTGELPEKVKGYLKAGDIVLTIGAGDITNVGPQLVRLLT